MSGDFFECRIFDGLKSAIKINKKAYAEKIAYAFFINESRGAFL